MSLPRHSPLALAGALIVTTFAVSLAVAQTARTGGTANAQLLQQLQQLASERTALQAENAQLKKDLDATRKDRDALKKAQQAVDGRTKATEAVVARTAAERDSKEKELQQTKDKLQEVIAKFRETIQTTREVELERATFKQNLATRDQELKVCMDHNAALYKLNGEVLDRLEHPSMWGRVAAAEPFTKIKRVQLENLADDYRSRAEDHMLPQSSAPPTATPAPADKPASSQQAPGNTSPAAAPPGQAGR